MFRAMVKAKGMPAYGDQVYTSSGTYTFTVPDNVEYIACVCVGGGGGGASNYICAAGGGGSLAYGTIKATAGETFTVVVGGGGSGGSYSPPGNSGDNGGASSISRSGTVLIQAKGGDGGGRSNTDTNILAAEVSRKGSYSGGAGATGNNGRFSSTGPGGGGAAGYAGNGGNGATGNGAAGTGGAGGGGGGGKWLSSNFSPYRRQGGYGGGVSLYGQGTSGAGGIYDTQPPDYNDNYGGPGSHDQGTDSGQSDQEYGGGGPCPAGANSLNAGFGGFSGKTGAVRIVWPGRARRYPSTNVAQ